MAQFIADTLKHVPGVDPRMAQRAQAFQGLNDGPAETAARLTGIVQGQHAFDDSPLYTTNFGQPLHHSGYPLNVGGIPVQADTALLEKQQAFDRSKIQERIVHPAGWAAFGEFVVTKDVTHLTKAKLFGSVGKKTPTFTRLSTVTYGREYPDSARNPRGHATKFYTEDGNYDLVGLNFPVFFVRDPFQGPDNIRSQQREPKSFLLNYNGWFDFLANVPESQHAGLMLFSDHATPVSHHFNAYGAHTFRWVNAEGKSTFIKYHWLLNEPIKNFNMNEATITCGEDPDFAKRDLYETIEKGGSVSWTMKVQTMTPEEATQVDFDPFDITKIWPRGQFPMQEVGVLTLNRNPEDYHRDVEQAAFSPGSLVPGIELSPDTLLQWRAFFYRDAQYTRLGSANIHQIPVNCPFMAKFVSPDNFMGTMRTDADSGSKPMYFPNSYHKNVPSTKSTPGFAGMDAVEAPYQVANNVVSRKSYWRDECTEREYTQVRELYLNRLSETERNNLHSNTARLLKFADDIVIEGYLAQQYAIHPGYATSINDLLPDNKKANMATVEEKSKTAHLVGKSEDFQPTDKGKSFMGMAY
ncbi:hypothetical protein FFLO_01360 [Filobasidium floriforme]|uniref:Catalase core domain-containing protein n=1 Tax=Filobasidium floriforme TaxID=5210 RepID=A0A8K0JPP2_9TREE|nr:hypothetical protein FFLO_01360 [Filobasidium floriforme]